MMLYPSIDELKKKADSRYTLVIMASKRARDLIDGYPRFVEAEETAKPVSIATEEISEGQITYSRKFNTEEEAEELFEEKLLNEEEEADAENIFSESAEGSASEEEADSSDDAAAEESQAGSEDNE